MEIKKAVITCAGKGTRMRPISNVIPKALLPVFKTFDGKKCPTSMIDLITDSLDAAGASQSCFVVDTKSRLLMDHLFEKDVTFVFQKEPKGPGDAVLKAEKFIGNEPFFVHFSDGFMTGGYKEGAKIFNELNADCLLFLSKVEDPKAFGVVEVEPYKEMHSHKVFKIKGVEEKPQSPKSNYAVTDVHIYSPKILKALNEIEKKSDKELYLTDGTRKLISEGGKVYGILLEDEKWLRIGNPADYFSTLNYSYNNL